MAIVTEAESFVPCDMTRGEDWRLEGAHLIVQPAIPVGTTQESPANLRETRHLYVPGSSSSNVLSSHHEASVTYYS